MYAPSIIREMQAELTKKFLEINIPIPDPDHVSIKLQSSGSSAELLKEYDSPHYPLAHGDFIIDSEDDLLLCLGVSAENLYYLRSWEKGGYSVDFTSWGDLASNGYTLVTNEILLEYEEAMKQDVEQITGILIEPNNELIETLMKNFDAERSFVELSLNLSADEVPELEEVSEAQTTEEAEAEHFKAEYCCDGQERAAFRRWLRLTNDPFEVVMIYKRVSCEKGVFEKMLAIKKLAIILQK